MIQALIREINKDKKDKDQVEEIKSDLDLERNKEA